MKKVLFSILLIIGISSQAFCNTSSYSEIGTQYELTVDDNFYIVNGFIPFSGQTDKTIFANAMLWTVENVCPQLRDGISDVNVTKLNFSCNFILESQRGNTFYCNASFSIANGRLIYYISDIKVVTKSFVSKNLTPFEKLNPEKKENHKLIMSDFTKTISSTLNNMFDFIMTNKPNVSHWDEIAISKPVIGMTEDECRIAFGKPKNIFESNGEIQWSYSTSFFIFLKNGKVTSFLK